MPVLLLLFFFRVLYLLVIFIGTRFEKKQIGKCSFTFLNQDLKVHN